MRAWLPAALTAAFVLVVTAPATYSGFDLLPSRERMAAVPAAAAVAPIIGEPSDLRWVDIRSQGARGDGVTDDTAAIQAALTEASDTSRPIFCPSGTYVVSSSLTLGTDFMGSPSVGRAACIIKYLGPGPALVVTANPVQMRNLVLDLTEDANTATGGILLPQACVHCKFASITVNGPPNGAIPYLNYGILLRGGGSQDRFTNISTAFATSAIIAGLAENRFYQSTLANVFATNCGQMPGRACLQITGAVDTIMNSGLGGGGFPGAPTRTAVLVAGSDAEAIDIIATELFANAPDGTAVVIRRPPHDVSVVTLIDVRLPVPAQLVSDIVTPPRLTRIATQESGAGPIGFISAAAPAAAFAPASDSGITLESCACTAVAGTVAFRTGASAPGGSVPFAAIRFKRAYPSAPIVILSWNSDSAATAGIYVDSTSTKGTRLRSSQLRPNTRYVLSYHVIEQ